MKDLVIPNVPCVCVFRCVYSKGGVCNNPNTYRLNDDATCNQCSKVFLLTHLDIIEDRTHEQN